MDGGHLLFDLPQQRGPQRSTGTSARPPARRAQPIRDAIMTFLITQRTVKEVAVFIGKKTSITTGHLRAMRAKDLVVRLSWGVWVRCDQCVNAPNPQTIRRNNPAQEFLLLHLQEPRSIDELQQITGRDRSKLRSLLSKMVRCNLVEWRGDDVIARATR